MCTSAPHDASADLRAKVGVRIADDHPYTTTETAHELGAPPAEVWCVYRKIVADRGENPRLERAQAARQRAMLIDRTK